MDKALMIRRLKLLELIIMSCAAAAIMAQSYLLMLLLLFLTGTQSAYFGPVKYSLLPQALREDELVTGNAGRDGHLPVNFDRHPECRAAGNQ